MALIGKGVLAIWNGISSDFEDEFVAWHVREHIPERVGLPGFLRGRRYVAIDGAPKYFNFYETEKVDDLSSPAYVARLNAPTEWTRKVVAHFLDTSRTICEVAWSLGRGEGGWIDAIQLDDSSASSDFRETMSASVTPALAAIPGLVGVHLLEGRNPSGQADTAEKKLRGGADRLASWILLVEASQPETLAAFRAGAGSNAALARSCGNEPTSRGIYQLQFALTKAELSATAG
jgi:hypothetical protein